MINERLNPQTGDYDGANARTDTLMHAVYVRLLTPLGSWFSEPPVRRRACVAVMIWRRWFSEPPVRRRAYGSMQC